MHVLGNQNHMLEYILTFASSGIILSYVTACAVELDHHELQEGIFWAIGKSGE